MNKHTKYFAVFKPNTSLAYSVICYNNMTRAVALELATQSYGKAIKDILSEPEFAKYCNRGQLNYRVVPEGTICVYEDLENPSITITYPVGGVIGVRDPVKSKVKPEDCYFDCKPNNLDVVYPESYGSNLLNKE